MNTPKQNRSGGLLRAIRRAWKAFQIWRLDRQYLALNRDLDWYESALAMARKQVEWDRISVMQRRRRLRLQYLELGDE